MKTTAQIVIFVLCFFTINGKAQIYFNNRYDNFNSCDAFGNIATYQNSYLGVGNTCTSVSYFSLNLELFDYFGIVTKSKTYAWFGNNFQSTFSKNIIMPNYDIIVGGTRAYKPDTSLAFLWRFNSNLDSVKYYEYGFLNKTNQINAIIKAENNIYMLGWIDSLYTNTNILLIKADTLGNEIWKKKIGLTSWDEIGITIDTLNGKLLIAGNKYPHGSSSTSGIVMCLDTAANIIWQKTVITNGGFGGCSAKRLSDGNILVYSRIKKYSIGSDDYYRLQCEKIDPLNNSIWKKEYNAPSISANPYSAIENNKGNIVIAGQIGTSQSTCNGIVNEINQNGDSLFTRQYANDFLCQNYFRDVIQALDKGYCFAGFFNPILANGCTGSQDIWLLKVDSNFCESSVPCGYGVGLVRRRGKMSKSPV